MARRDKQPLNLSLDDDTVYRIKRYALESGSTASDVVARLVADNVTKDGSLIDKKPARSRSRD